MPGLTATRKVGDSIRVDGPCVFTVTRIGRNSVSVNIQAAPEVKILRSELDAKAPEESNDEFDTGGIPK